LHRAFANDDWDKSVDLVDQTLALYPLLSFGSRTTVLDAALKKNTDQSNAAAQRLCATWARMDDGDPDKARARAAILLAAGLQRIRNPTRADQVLAQVFDTIPAAKRDEILAERAELEIVVSNDSGAAANAVADARLSKSLRDDLAANGLLIRALVNTKRDADAQEALALYQDTLGRFSDHSFSFYTSGDGLLATLGTPEKQEQNWEVAAREFPNNISVLDKLAKSQIATSHPRDSLKTMTTLFEIVDPEPYYLQTMEAIWTSLQDPSTLTATLTNFMNASPRLFKGVLGSHALSAAQVSANHAPQQLKLVPQMPLEQRVTGMVLNPEGTLAAVADAGGSIELWSIIAPQPAKSAAQPANACTSSFDLTCPRILRLVYAHTGRIANLQFSGDSQWLITTGEDDNAVKVWSVATGQLAWSLQGPPINYLHAVAGPAVKGQPQLLAIFLQESLPPKQGETNSFNTWSTLRLCPLNAGNDCRDIHWYSNAMLDKDNDQPLAWASDGKLLAARISKSETLLVNPATMDLMRAPQSIAVPAHAVFSPDLSSVVFPDGSDLKAQSLAPGAKAATVAHLPGDDAPLSTEILPDGRIRYAVLDPEPVKPKDSDDDASSTDSKHAKVAPPERDIELFELGADAIKATTPAPPVRIAAIPAADYPSPGLQLGSLTDRFTVYSTALMAAPANGRAPDLAPPTATTAIGYFTPANAGRLVLQLLASEQQLVPNSVTFSRDGRYLLVGRSDPNRRDLNTAGQTRLDIWDLAVDGRPVKLKDRPSIGPTVAFNAGVMVTCPTSGSGIDWLRSYDLAGHPIRRPVDVQCRKDVPVTAFADGSGVAWSTAAYSVAVALEDGSTWNVPQELDPEAIKAVAATAGTLVGITEHDLYVVHRGAAAAVNLCDERCPSGSDTPLQGQPDPAFSSVAISTDGRYAVAAIGPSDAHATVQPTPDFGVIVADLQANSLRVEKDSAGTSHMAMTAVAFLPNSTRYAAGTVDGRLLLADAASSGMQVLDAQDSPVSAIAVSPDGQFLAAAFGSGAVGLWQLGAGAPALARLDTFDDDDWSVVRPNGQYDAARDGRLDELLWVYGNQTVQLDQMLSSYYRPRLLPRLLQFDTTALADSPPLNTRQPSLPPTVNIQSIDSSTGEIVLSTDSPAAAIGAVKVYANGALVETAPRQVTPNGDVHVKLATNHALVPGELNHVSVVVGNQNDSIESRGAHSDFVAGGKAVATQKEFYAIIAGISNYGPGLDSLPLADADAREMAMDVARGATRLVGDPMRVHVYLLTSDAKLGTQVQSALQAAHLGSAEWSSPTHDNFLAAFKKVQGLKPQDVFLLFLAGHGQLFGANREYGYPTSEFTSNGEPAAGTYLTSAELRSSLQKTQASNTILLFDTCNAGAVQAALDGETRDLAVANKSQHDNDGSSFILMGASADKSAFDSKDLNHGFLTTGLLLSMREDLNGDKLMAREWLLGAQTRTDALATARGYSQHAPDTNNGPDLQVGLFKSQDLACIPDLNGVPVVTRPTMEDELRHANNGAMQNAVVELLKAEAQPSTGKPTFIYYDEVSNPDYISVTGHYSQSFGQLKMTLTFSYADAHYKTMTLAPVTASGDITDTQRTALAQEAAAAIGTYARSVWVATAPHVLTTPASCLLAGTPVTNQ
jgi:WD40 repeat protein